MVNEKRCLPHVQLQTKFGGLQVQVADIFYCVYRAGAKQKKIICEP